MKRHDWSDIRGQLQARHAVPEVPDAAAFRDRLRQRLEGVRPGSAPTPAVGTGTLMFALAAGLLLLAGAGVWSMLAQPAATADARNGLAARGNAVESVETPAGSGFLIVSDPRRKATMILVSGLNKE